ncbi:MAG TPA: nitric-oxide reductase large subunit [Pyrinomonadaceae bacterium]|nr:nitric-oxide reductase large subunit [Chloracidobacterium sp.]MBP9936865.1 nitric-oxide reductase large subunit [Pyrinomonadaceae bacterium]HQX56063.1 nitric-oxide reductase large subunit [Pyrinomonadaceae bacterium]HQY68607.1 nitric-oxide reductase large subunit [Pyrinomonadaceae bacterium]HRA41372.1 nitric-oxide reductase large subunit [Pyrinomonadaceae bacterium]
MKKLWIILLTVFIASFAILGWVGTEIFRQAPPIPSQVVTSDGRVVADVGSVTDGQNVWQAMGGMQVGSIWGHGSYVAPDWTADYLHRECIFILNAWSNKEFAKGFDAASPDQQAVLKARLEVLMRTNTYDPASGKITIDPVRAAAFEDNLKHYSEVFTDGNSDYAIQRNAQSDPTKLRQMTSFFFWTAWASAANRPDNTISYTSNFPSEPLVGNVPTSSAIVWTGVSVIMLIAGIGAMVWFYAGWRKPMDEVGAPDADPLIGQTLTPSQKATVKYFLVVSLLFLLQIVMGIITAHYGVEGGGLYGIPLADYLPYVVSRTWHTQLGIFWIATAWLAAGLYIAPYICGYEPKLQKLGVDVLFGALLVVVLGSMAGEWMSVMHKLGTGDLWFWFGHQGYEYVDLGRVWQAALLVGLLLWLFLIARSAIPALKHEGNSKSLIMLYLATTAGIAFFYAPGLFWGMRTHLTEVEYWRWWVVHLWVEGFFEVFATVVVAFLFARLKVINSDNAAYASLLSGAIYLSGGIIGTLHHLYFAGTPTIALAFGSVFSALEIVPLVFVGFEAFDNIRHSQSRPWLGQYQWVVYFFVAVAFWNLVGAGIFGFMINPPIALYYMQGLNTTAVHAHGSLYGVYGTLGLALLLFCMRAMEPERKWNTKLLAFSFWTINIGLLMEILFSLLPIGLLQTYQSVSKGYWAARGPEFMQTDLMQVLRWMRLFGDTVFAIGAVAFVWFALKLMLTKGESVSEEVHISLTGY